MSHVSEYKVKVKNLRLLADACDELGFDYELSTDVNVDLIVKQYGRNEVKAAMRVKLPGWGYDVAITEDGRLLYDHFGSKPNTIEYLGKLVQKYNQNAIAESCWDKTMYSEVQKDGSIKVVIGG